MRPTPQLLERDEQLALLDQAIADVAGGHGRMVLIGGEAGIGKTSLVRQFVAGQGKIQVAFGACDPLPIAPALGPVLDIASDLGPAFEQLLDGARSGSELFVAIASLLAAWTAPVVLVFEDIHWADQVSLELVGFLGRRIERLRALLIVTFRADETTAGGLLATLLGNLTTAPGVMRLTLGPLSRSATAELADQRLEEVDELYRRTGGNPFFLTEILGTTDQNVPATVRDAVLARLARRSAEVRKALQAAAALGGRIDPSLLASILDASNTPRWAVQEAISANFLEQQGPWIVFRHELVQAAILDAIPPDQRQNLHSIILAERRRRISEREEYAILARHAAAAADDVALIELAPLAAAHAAALGAHREAIQLLTQALVRTEDQPRIHARLLEMRGIQHYFSRRFAAASHDHRLAADLCHGLADVHGEARNLIWFAYVSLAAGERGESDAALRRATALVENVPACREQAMAYEAWSRRLFMSNEPQQALHWADRAIAIADALDDPDLVLEARITAAVSRVLAGDDSGRTELEKLRELARQRSQTDSQFQDTYARVTFYLALMPMVHRQYADVDRYIEDGWRYALDHQLDYWENLMAATRALRSMDAGRWQDAGEQARHVLALPEPAWRAKLVAAIIQARMLARTGQPDARHALEQAEGYASHDPPLQPMLWPVRAEAAWLAGDMACIRELAVAAALRPGPLDPWWEGELAFWTHLAGEAVNADEITAEPFRLAVCGRWAEAARWWERRGCPYEMAITLTSANEPAALRRAIAVLDELGARPAASYARRRLRAMGVKSVPRGPRPSTSANPAGLTRREQEILELVAAGLKNHEIARHLFLSEKTIERHLAGIFNKLDVASRGEAVRAAARLGALPTVQIEGPDSPI